MMNKHYCKAARDCGCTVWDHGKVKPICAELHCLDYAILEPPTNAERIRAMDDKELAETLAVFQCEGWNKCCDAFQIEGHRIDGHGENPDILAWLQQPAPGEGEQNV